MSEQVHGNLGNLGHAGGDREQQHERDEKPHGLSVYCGAIPMSRQPTSAAETPASAVPVRNDDPVALELGRERT
jgi:hypothetical protein